MAPIVVGGVCRYSLHGVLGSGEEVVNIMDVHIDILSVSNNRLEAIEATGARLVSNWQDHIVADLGNSYVFTGGQWVDLNSVDGTTGLIDPDPGQPTTGGSSSAQLPPNVALLVHKNLQGATRTSRRGRMYLPALAESAVDDSGNVSSAHRDGMAANLESFKDGVNGQFSTPELYNANCCVVHNPSVGATSFSHISTFSVDGKVATQQRRLR